MSWKMTKRLLAAIVLMSTGTAWAEDIDLFHKITLPGSVPNVLFVLDNGANFSAEAKEACTYNDGTSPSLGDTAGGIEQCAFYNVIDSLKVGETGEAIVNIGFMAYNANGMEDINGADCTGSTGGCLIVPLMPMTQENKDLMKAWIKSWKANESDKTGFNIKTNSQATGAAMQEAWAHYAGRTGLSGRTYEGVKAGCQKDYVIFIGNAYNNASGPGDSDAVLTALNNAPSVTEQQKTLIGGTYTNSCGTVTFPTSPVSKHNNGGLGADEWARYMKDSRELISYTVGFVNPGACKPDYPALLANMADLGGGKYFETNDYSGLETAINAALTEIQAVNSVFASASLPVSVNTQGTFLNQVFIGMFRPDAQPRWNGNMKQYKFKAKVAAGGGYDLNLVDADEELAINTSTGFITQCARSFWTPPTVNIDSYWDFEGSLAKGACSETTMWSNTPDGDVVEKGGAGYMLREHEDPATRDVYTCSACTKAEGLAAFPATTDLEKWVRGADVKDENGDSDKTEMRPSTLGDVVHSRPVAVDYDGTTGVVVFYGANDGMLHAVNGNQTGTGAGEELWSFVAPEHISRLQRIYDNEPLITFPATIGKPSKPYFFDGPVAAYQGDGDGDGSNDVWIYASQRRGGRMVYAFDASTPAAPKLMWRAGCTTELGDDSGCMTGFEGMGQTWSAPKALYAENYGSGNLPLLIMGGGYDTCEDAEPNTCSAPKGNKIYVIDAKDGTLEKEFTTIRSVAADVTVVPNQFTGMADYAYAADTGGNVYRINIGADAPADWTMTKVAALGCDVTPCDAGGELNRKFLFAPEVVVVSPNFNAVLVGSGDREHPLPLPIHQAPKVENAFFMLQDKPWDSTWLGEEKDVCGEAALCLKSLWPMSNDGTAATQAELDTKKGWSMMLSPTEQVVTSAVVLFGETTFSTHMPVVPDPDSCTSSLGTARVYNIRYLTGGAVYDVGPFAEIAGGGLPPSPVSGKVTVANPTTGDPMTVPFIIGASKESPVEVTLKTGGSGIMGSKERVYWYLEQ